LRIYKSTAGQTYTVVRLGLLAKIFWSKAVICALVKSLENSILSQKALGLHCDLIELELHAEWEVLHIHGLEAGSFTEDVGW
jgi:hypothetical protein